MSSTYSSNLRIELIGSGDQAGAGSGLSSASRSKPNSIATIIASEIIRQDEHN